MTDFGLVSAMGFGEAVATMGVDERVCPVLWTRVIIDVLIGVAARLIWLGM